MTRGEVRRRLVRAAGVLSLTGGSRGRAAGPRGRSPRSSRAIQMAAPISPITTPTMPRITPACAVPSPVVVMPFATCLRPCTPVTQAEIEHGSEKIQPAPSVGIRITRPRMPSTSDVVARPFVRSALPGGEDRMVDRMRPRVDRLGRRLRRSRARGRAAPARTAARVLRRAPVEAASPGPSARPPWRSELGLDPVHHRAQLLALALDLVAGLLLAHALEVLLAGAVLGDPLARERA